MTHRSTVTTVLIAGCLATAAHLACRTGARPPGPAARVVLVSYDGVGADLLESWLSAGETRAPDGLATMAREGLRVRRLEPVDPTLTAVVHATLASGRPPAATGIVGNTFRHPATSITEEVNGFSAPISSETLWQAARRQGHRVGVLLWPSGDAAKGANPADFGLLWPTEPLVGSAVFELDPAAAGTAADLPQTDGVAPLVWDREVGLSEAVPAVVAWRLAVVDGTPDGRPRFDTVAVWPPGAEAWEFVVEREFFPLEVPAVVPGHGGTRRWGSWSTVLHVDRFSGAVRLYRGAFYRLLAYPESFAARLEEAVGFWPGPPDDDLLAAWWLEVGAGIDLDTYLAQAERLDRYLDQVLAVALAAGGADLVLAYHPIADEYQHSSLITDRRQWAYSEGRALAAREGLRRVAWSVDRSVAHAWSLLDGERDVLAVVSDHGQAPLHDEVELNLVLADAGLVELTGGEGSRRVAATSPMVALGRSGCAHLYLNLRGREPTGVVAPADAAELLRRATHALADLVVDGQPVVERTLTREEAGSVGLAHPATGDLVVFFNPGFRAADELVGPAVRPSRLYGTHGYLSHHDAMAGVLLARGAGVRRARRDTLAATEVAGLVSRWLGIQPPS